MRGTRLLVAAATTCVVGAVLVSPPAQARSTDPAPSDVMGMVVTREAGTSAAEAQALVEDEVGATTERAPVAPGVTAVTVPSLGAADARDAARSLEAQDGIARVDLDTRVFPDAIPNDPRFSEQWSLTNILSGSAAVPAWDLTAGTGQVIAIVDSGITVHEDLAGNVVPGYDMIQDGVVANDGDGRDADPTDRGDWVRDSDRSAHPELFGDCPLQPESSWHGTHVAGLAAAVQNNSRGISGIAPAAKIQPVRALGKCGGKMSDIAAAITWASGGEVPGTPVNTDPADVINLSVSSAATCQPFLQSAIDGAIKRGAVVVASAGNNAMPFAQASPGGCYDVITTGAVDRAGSRAAYSNYGVAGRDLPLFAPGGVDGTSQTAVLSTVNGGTTVPTAATDGYAAYAGTSMAAALVSGAAALLRARTAMSPAAVAEHLRDTARPFPPGSNCTGACGAGILDVNAALRTAPRLPAAPTGLTVTAADAAVVASWEAPVDPGTGPIVGYDVQYRPLQGDWIALENAWPSTLRQKLIKPLTNGVSYQVRVAARSVFGTGSWAESNVVTPVGLPGSVQIGSVRYPSKASARVALRLPSDVLTGVQYRLTRAGQVQQTWQTTAVTSQLRLSGLAKGVRHSIEVRAVNALGAGPTARRQIATPVKPSAVRSLTVTRKGKRAIVTWREPRRTGLKLAYRVRAGVTGPWLRTAEPALTLRGVARGPLRVAVQPQNQAGRGPVQSIVKRK